MTPKLYFLSGFKSSSNLEFLEFFLIVIISNPDFEEVNYV